MPIIKNICAGDRGAYLAGALIMLAPGQTGDADDFPEEWFEVVEALAEPVEPDFAEMTVAELKAFAEAADIDLGDVTKKADIISAIELAREERAA